MRNFEDEARTVKLAHPGFADSADFKSGRSRFVDGAKGTAFVF
jgi:hypothetical protein